MAPEIPELRAIIAWGIDKIPADLANDKRIFTFKNFLTLGKNINDTVIDGLINKQKPGNCCCLIYTSGTTGNPKGVMLSHDNLIYQSTNIYCDIMSDLGEDNKLPPKDSRTVSYLPLSHIAGMAFDLSGHVL